MVTAKIKLIDIPKILLPVIRTNDNATIWVNGKLVKKILIFKNRFRILTIEGEYRYDLDTDLELVIIS